MGFTKSSIYSNRKTVFFNKLRTLNVEDGNENKWEMLEKFKLPSPVKILTGHFSIVVMPKHEIITTKVSKEDFYLFDMLNLT